jgi:hypothetical protein
MTSFNQAEYKRQWRIENRERLIAYNKNYHQEHREEIILKKMKIILSRSW